MTNSSVAWQADHVWVDQEVVEVDEIPEQDGDVRCVVGQLTDGIAKQVERLQRLEPAQADELRRRARARDTRITANFIDRYSLRYDTLRYIYVR